MEKAKQPAASSGPDGSRHDKGSGNIWISIGITAAITVLITLAMMVLSAQTGGFASDSSGSAAGLRGWSLPIMIHLMSVLPALIIGAAILWRRKGTAAHRLWGRIYAGLMFITAITSIFIGAPGTGIAGTGFSFIHIFTIITLTSLPYAIWCARTGRIDAHRGAMQGLYVGLCVAGLFTLIPGRLLGNAVFG